MDTPPLPRRKTIRLQNYDYSQNGAYFVTICTAHKRPLFGVVRRGRTLAGPFRLVLRQHKDHVNVVRHNDIGVH